MLKLLKIVYDFLKKSDLDGANVAYFQVLVQGRTAARIIKQIYTDLDYDEELFYLWIKEYLHFKNTGEIIDENIEESLDSG